MEKAKPIQMNVDIKQTTPVKDINGKVLILNEGTILRKGSRFLLGTDSDPLIPIPIYYNIENNKILLDLIPKEIRDDYEDIGFYINS